MGPPPAPPGPPLPRAPLAGWELLAVLPVGAAESTAGPLLLCEAPVETTPGNAISCEPFPQTREEGCLLCDCRLGGRVRGTGSPRPEGGSAATCLALVPPTRGVWPGRPRSVSCSGESAEPPCLFPWGCRGNRGGAAPAWLLAVAGCRQWGRRGGPALPRLPWGPQLQGASPGARCFLGHPRKMPWRPVCGAPPSLPAPARHSPHPTPPASEAALKCHLSSSLCSRTPGLGTAPRPPLTPCSPSAPPFHPASLPHFLHRALRAPLHPISLPGPGWWSPAPHTRHLLASSVPTS